MTTDASGRTRATQVDIAPVRRSDHADYITLLNLTTTDTDLTGPVGEILALSPFGRPFTHGPALCMAAYPRRSANPNPNLNPNPVGAVFASFPNWVHNHPLCQADPDLSQVLSRTVFAIHGVAVAPCSRRQGIARALAFAAEDRARSAGYRLSTLIHKAELAPFYERLGYTTAGRITILLPYAGLGTTQPHPFMTAVKPLAPTVRIRTVPGAPDARLTFEAATPHAQPRQLEHSPAN